jgi:hypothetical protein
MMDQNLNKTFNQNMGDGAGIKVRQILNKKLAAEGRSIT